MLFSLKQRERIELTSLDKFKIFSWDLIFQILIWLSASALANNSLLGLNLITWTEFDWSPKVQIIFWLIISHNLMGSFSLEVTKNFSFRLTSNAVIVFLWHLNSTKFCCKGECSYSIPEWFDKWFYRFFSGFRKLL